MTAVKVKSREILGHADCNILITVKNNRFTLLFRSFNCKNVVLLVICMTFFAGSAWGSQQCLQLFQNEKSLDVFTKRASGTTVVLDTNIAQNFVFWLIFRTAFLGKNPSELLDEYSSLQKKIASGLINEELLFRSSKYGLDLLNRGIISENQYKIARVQSRIDNSGPMSFLALLNERFEGHKDFELLLTPTILSEVFSSEFNLEDGKLVWRGPGTFLKSLIGSATLDEVFRGDIGILGQQGSVNSAAKDDFLKSVKALDLGGRNGAADQSIAAELKFADLAPGTKLGFATSDVNLIRGLLRLHFGSVKVADAVLQKLRKGSKQEILAIDKGIEEVTFNYNHRFGDWRHGTQRRARHVVIKGIQLGEGRSIDLYGYFEIE